MTLDWSVGLYAYLGIGGALLASVLIHHLLTRKKRSAWVRAAMEAVEPERKTLRYKVLSDLAAPALAGVFIWALWPVALIMVAKGKFDELQSEKVIRSRKAAAQRPVVELEDLIERTTIEQVETQEIISDPLGAVPPAPFGHLFAAWIKFRSQLLPNDEIWKFNSRTQTDWGKEEHTSGYAAIRGSKIVAHFVARKGSRPR
jgi:hypothetical protein